MEQVHIRKIQFLSGLENNMENEALSMIFLRNVLF